MTQNKKAVLDAHWHREEKEIRVCVFAVVSDQVPCAQMGLITVNVEVVKNECQKIQ